MAFPVNRGNQRSGVVAASGGQGSGSNYQQPRIRPVLISIPIAGIGAGAVQGPAFDVPEGCTVEVLPDANNAGTVTFATAGPQAAQTGPNEQVQKTANFPREINIRNLSQLWVVANIGDKLRVTVRRPQQ